MKAKPTKLKVMENIAYLVNSGVAFEHPVVQELVILCGEDVDTIKAFIEKRQT